MGGFFGRERELATLDRHFTRVARGDRPGRAILVRGHRGVGKSRLIEEFIRRSGVPSLFFTADQGTISRQLKCFVEDAAASDLPHASLFEDTTPSTWGGALQLLARAAPQDSPSIVVIDDLPLLIGRSPRLEGELRQLFDHELSRRPIVLILAGSDPSAMEGISRAFSLRAAEILINPFTPADVAETLDLPPADAIDAHLITGGLPLILRQWPVGATTQDFLNAAISRSTSALIVSGERATEPLLGNAQARAVFRAIGSGRCTHSSIVEMSHGIPDANVARGLHALMDQRMITAEAPLSVQASGERRYRVTDPHLDFWLSFMEPGMPEIYRGRGDLVLRRIERSWTAWRSAAVKPFVRESLRRMGDLPEGTGAVGGYWTRTNSPEIDLVGADREPVAKAVTLVGSVKWLENRAFDHHDLSELIVHRSKMPGADTATPLYAVSRGGCEVQGVRYVSPEELMEAWR